jgi:predicted anti-sigma-YlaC factor YlaD
MAVNALADSMSRSSVVYARDDDPELVADALPFLLKTLEGLLLEAPKNETLLVTACQAFTSYAQAFLAVPADTVELDDLGLARRERHRAAGLFVRARGYGLRALELRHPGIGAAMEKDPDRALTVAKKDDLPALFWTGAAWAGAINVSKGNMDLVADLNVANALLARADALDPGWNRGAVHEVLIALEAARSGGGGGSLEGAREQYRIAMDLCEGKRAGPRVTLAESVSIKEQNLEEFRRLLHEALAVDVDAVPDDRLANVLAQRRARWLLAHADLYFVDYQEPEEHP